MARKARKYTPQELEAQQRVSRRLYRMFHCEPRMSLREALTLEQEEKRG